MIVEISNWIEKQQKPIPSGTHWFKTLDDKEGQPCIRTYALHVLKNKPYEYKEVVRDYFNGDIMIHGDLYFCGAAGYRVMWHNRNCYSYYMPKECDDKWYIVDLKQRPGMFCIELFTDDDVNRIFKKYIPYFQYESGMCVMEYATRYRDYASAEQLVKSGFGYLVMDKRVLKLSKASKKKLIHWLIVNQNYVKEHKPLYGDISKAVKQNISIEELYYRQTIDVYEKEFKEAKIRRTRIQCEEIYKYLNNAKRPQNIGLHDYIEYLQMAKEDGYNMSLKSTIYPIDAARAHDHIVKKRKAKLTRKTNQKLKRIYDLLKGYEIHSKDLKIVIPRNQSDFVNWGKELKICVGSYGYDEKMIKGDCIILMIYINDKPLECCELITNSRGNNLMICQLRGEHNQSSERHEDAVKLVNRFINNYHNQHIIGACI